MPGNAFLVADSSSSTSAQRSIRILLTSTQYQYAFITTYYDVYRGEDPLLQAIKGWYWGTKEAVVYVSPDGICLGNSPCYETLQAGSEAAGDGFSVRVKQGGYGEDIVLDEAKRIEFKGGGIGRTFPWQTRLRAGDAWRSGQVARVAAGSCWGPEPGNTAYRHEARTNQGRRRCCALSA
jgi:hypothetical protein